MPLHDPDDPFDSLVFLSPEGKLEGPAAPKDQRRPPESWTQTEPPPLELNPVGYQAPAEPAAPDEEALARAARARQHQQLAIGVAVIVLLGAAAAFFLLKALTAGSGATALDQTVAADGAAAFTVQSEPPGANVFIGDELLGTTPFLGTNDVAPGQEVKVRLELPGYADWTGALTGGRNVSLLAHLKKKK